MSYKLLPLKDCVVLFTILALLIGVFPSFVYADTQIEPRFPEENSYSQFYIQGRRVFKGYEGRGQLFIKNHGVKSAKLYINGKPIILDEVLKKSTSRIDIGDKTINGYNTLKVLDIFPEDAYLEIFISYPELIGGRPEEVGFSEEKLKKVDELINSEIEEGFPGAVLLIMKDGKIIKNTAYGYKKKYDGDKTLKKPEPMTVDTMFDLASCSKVFSTNFAIQKLVSEDKIKLDNPVQVYLPDFTGEGREKITVRDLLAHCAGFASSVRFYMPDSAGEFYSIDREKTMKILNKVPLEYEPRSKTVYSDTGYMLLGKIIETVTKKRQDEYVENEIYKHLGLEKTMYIPLDKGVKKEDCASTEIFGNTRGFSRDYPKVRKYTLQGEVHDEKAFYSMKGVSGHAGLFSTTKELAVLCQVLLNQGGYGNIKLFDKNVLDQFIKPSDNSITHGIGYNRAGNQDKITQFGPYASNWAYGHTGWTGTCFLVDPQWDMAIVLLTNKKHSPFEDGVFQGDKFETGKYGSIMSLIYEALLEN